MQLPNTVFLHSEKMIQPTAHAWLILSLYHCRRGHIPDARGVQPAGQPQGAQLPGAQVAPGGIHLILSRQDIHQATARRDTTLPHRGGKAM